MIREAIGPEKIALAGAVDLMQSAGLPQLILLGWPKPHGDAVGYVGADVDAYDLMETASLLAGVAGTKALKDGSPRTDISHSLWVLLVAVAQSLGLSAEEMQQGMEMTKDDMLDAIIRDNKK